MINSISGKYFSVKVKLFQYFLIQTCAHANGLTVREKTVDTMTEQNYSYSGAPNENIVQNHLNIALLNVF